MRKFNEFVEQKEENFIENELNEFENEIFNIMEVKKSKHPGKDVSKKEKSELVKKARKGEDLFGAGKNFEKIAKKAAKRYGSKEAGKRVAGAIFWKKAGKKGMVESANDDMIWIIEDDIDVILDSFNKR